LKAPYVHLKGRVLDGNKVGQFMTYIETVGYLAACASTSSFAPQAWKIIRSRSTKDISTGMYLLTVLGFALWLVFGVVQRQWPLVASNTVCLGLSGFILFMKLIPARKKQAIADSILH